MATPHVAGAAALLVQRHPSWSPQQIKSALMSTAGAAWGDTARTQEAPVTLEGAGLINVARADDPQIFTDPASLSLGSSTSTRRSDAKPRSFASRTPATAQALGGARSSRRRRARRDARPAARAVASRPAARPTCRRRASAGADAAAGDDMGFVVLTKGAVTRRIPYYFEVDEAGARDAASDRAEDASSGRHGHAARTASRSIAARPWPFGPPPTTRAPR